MTAKIHSATVVALDVEEESGASTQRQRNEHESPEEHVNEIGTGKWCGTSHPRDMALERHHFLWEVRRMGNVSADTADEGLHRPAKNACI